MTGSVMEYHDPVSQQKDVRIYRRAFFLWKQQWDVYTDPPIPLDWQCVKFERGNASQIPKEKGVYAFFIEPRIAKFPSHGYLIYIGQSGYKSKRDLRKRFRDYFYDKKRPKKIQVNLMLNTWEDYLYFYYAKVDPAQIDLKQLEQKLLDTFTPPYVKRGYSAYVKEVIKGLE